MFLQLRSVKTNLRADKDLPEQEREADGTECGESELGVADGEVRRCQNGANKDVAESEPIGGQDTEEHKGDHTARLE